jgi:hypothetical protein
MVPWGIISRGDCVCERDVRYHINKWSSRAEEAQTIYGCSCASDVGVEKQSRKALKNNLNDL